MDMIKTLVDFILNIDAHLDYFIMTYHSFTYYILFLIVFVETGLVIMPFLPGDSLLFAIGAFTARGSFDFWTISLALLAAAVIGDNVNYAIGKYFGEKLFTKSDSKLFNKKYLKDAHNFYEKYGPRALVIARFVPIIRTFAPFVAGIGQMTYRRFLFFSVTGGVLWIFSFITLGYFFGNIPVVKANLKLVMLGIIFVSILPALIEFVRAKRKHHHS